MSKESKLVQALRKEIELYREFVEQVAEITQPPAGADTPGEAAEIRKQVWAEIGLLLFELHVNRENERVTGGSEK